MGQLKVYLDDETHRRFAIYAVNHGTKMNTVMRTLIKQILDNEILPEDIDVTAPNLVNAFPLSSKAKEASDLEKQAKLVKDVLEHYNDEEMPPSRRGDAFMIYMDFAKDFGIDHLPVPKEIQDLTPET